MENDVRIIDMRNIFSYLKSKVVFLILAVIFGCAALGGYNYMKQKKDVDNVVEANVDLLKMTMTQNHNAFYFKKDNTYSDAEPYKGIYNSYAKVYIDFNFDDIENYENTDFSMVSTALTTDATLLLWDADLLNEVIDDLQLHSYGDMKNITPDKLQWLINKNILGAHVMNIVVSDVDPERAKAICDKLIEKFVKKSGEVSFIDSVTVINYGSLPTDNSFFGKSATVTPTKEIDKKRVLKYGIAGGFAGFVFVAVVFVIWYIINDAVRCEADLAFLGLDSVTGSYRKKLDHSRVAHSINLYEAYNKVLLVAIDNKVSAGNFAGEVKKELKAIGSDKKIEFAENFKDDADALAKVKECDAVIYLVKHNRTRLSDISEAKKMLGKADAKCLGGIML